MMMTTIVFNKHVLSDRYRIGCHNKKYPPI